MIHLCHIFPFGDWHIQVGDGTDRMIHLVLYHHNVKTATICLDRRRVQSLVRTLILWLDRTRVRQERMTFSINFKESN